MFKKSWFSIADTFDQPLDVGATPTFAGATLSGLTASTVIYSNANKAITSLANGAGYLLNDGSGGLSWAAVSLSGYLKADGTVPLTADWNVGAFDLTCVDMNATNFKLSGTGTLTSTAGNASFTTSLTAASGNEVALSLNYTTNKAAGNDTGLQIVQTDTASPGTSYLIWAGIGDTNKFTLTNSGVAVFAGSLTTTTVLTPFVSTVDNNTTLVVQSRGFSGTASDNAIEMAIGTNTKSQNVYNAVAILPIHNASSTNAATDVLINRTETAVGSGQQNLIDAQVGSTSRFRISNKGFETRAYPLACTHDTATALFGIAVTAGNTAGGVITYTLNVTDDDGSDDQIEVGTVQFVGLQDEANWHTNISEVSTQALESGTLSTTWAIDTATADTLKITLQANSNLTSPVYTLSYTVTFNNAYTVTTY